MAKLRPSGADFRRLTPPDKKPQYKQQSPKYADVLKQTSAPSKAKKIARGIVIALAIIILAVVLIYALGG